jgi:hypothetical protein
MSRSVLSIRTALAAGLVLAALALTPFLASAAKLEPLGRHTPVAVDVNGTVYRYYELTSEGPLSVRLKGPAVFEALVRWRFEDSPNSVDAIVELVVDGEIQFRYVVHATPGSAVYPDNPDAIPGRSEKLTFDVPSGEHTIELRLISPAGGTLDVNPLSKTLDLLPWRVEWRGSLGSTYDSNLFRYSDGDVDDFLDGERYERYPFDTLDELRVEPGVALGFVREKPGVRETEFRFSGNWFVTGSNGQKSFSKFRVAVTETRTGVAWLKLEYSAIPLYHLKYVWDADATGEGESMYRSCDFRKHSLLARAGSDRSLPVDLTAWWKIDSYGYDQDFVEYDSHATMLGLSGTWRPARGLRLDAGYALRMLVARGYDEVGETRSESDDSDTTYDQNEYGLRARWEAGKVLGRSLVLQLRGKLAQRYYLAADVDDAYHTGRDDSYVTLGGGFSLSLADGVKLEGFYEHKSRRSESDIIATIGDTKDYDADRITVRLVAEGVRFLD